MSQPKRFALRLPDISYGTEESQNGNFVLHSDYAALQAENERLRKAGDELARVAIPSYILDVKTKAIEAWLAAKGERP